MSKEGSYMNTKQLTKLSLVVLGSLLTVASASALGQKHISFNKINATGNEYNYNLTITNFVQTYAYTSSGSKVDRYAVAQLYRPGTYCLFNDYSSDSGTWFNDGTKLYENTFRKSGTLNLMIQVDPINNLYFNEGDEDPINLIGFSNLQTIQIFMCANNQVGIDYEWYSTNRSVTSSYNSETNSYIFSCDFRKKYVAFEISHFSGDEDALDGKLFAIKQIKLTYTCGQLLD